jgi:hypothetical protein
MFFTLNIKESELFGDKLWSGKKFFFDIIKTSSSYFEYYSPQLLKFLIIQRILMKIFEEYNENDSIDMLITSNYEHGIRTKMMKTKNFNCMNIAEILTDDIVNNIYTTGQIEVAVFKYTHKYFDFFDKCYQFKRK